MHEIILFVVGIIVGAMNAIAGGGMLLGFPVLIATGLTPLVANATAGIIVLPGQLTSGYGYRKYLRTVPRRYLLLLLPCFVGGAIGAWLLKSTPSDKFAELVPGLIFMAVLLFAYQPFLHRHLHLHLHGPLKFRQRIRPLVVIGIAIFPVSIYGGYFGAGYGFVMLALFGFTKLHHMHQINAMKNLAVATTVIAVVIVLIPSGLIDWKSGITMGIGTAIGGYSGSILAQRVSSHAIRVVVVAIGLSSATYLAFRAY